MPIVWDAISPIYPLSSDGKAKALICDSCASCDTFGKCTASECGCFAIMLVEKSNFVCPLGNF